MSVWDQILQKLKQGRRNLISTPMSTLRY